MVYLRTVFALIACQERRRRYPQEYNTKGKGHHGRRATPATVRGEPGGVRTLEAPGGVSPLYPRVPRLPPRDRIALAILRPLRDTVGHALPGLRQPVATARCACLPPVWRGITTGPALRPTQPEQEDTPWPSRVTVLHQRARGGRGALLCTGPYGLDPPDMDAGVGKVPTKGQQGQG